MLVLTKLDADKIAECRARDEFFWLDLKAPAAADLDVLGQLLGLHPVALEDTREFGQRPKLDVYDDHLLLVFYTARVRGTDAHALEVHIYLAGGFAITVRRDSCDVLDVLHEQLHETPTDDEGFLVYRILDTLADAFYPAVDILEEQLDPLEGMVLNRARREHLRDIYRLRQEVRELLRIVATQRDQYPAAAEAIRTLPGLRQGTVEYLRDVGDHLAQIAGELQRQIDDLNALTATYFNANADRLNVVATRLTIIGTIFIIWTVFTGFFGQNFAWLVGHINTKAAFFGLGIGLPVGVTVIVGALMWIKRRDLF